MTEHRFDDETATLIVLSSVVRDMKHTLEWLAAGLIGLTVYFALEAFEDFRDHKWGGLVFHILFAAWGAWSWFDTIRRARKYWAGVRR